MPPRRPPSPSPLVAFRIVTLWGVAGIIGMTVAVTIALKQPVASLPPALGALLGIGAGWVVMLLLAPWRLLLGIDSRLEHLQRITRELGRITAERREHGLPEPLLRRDDELGILARAINDALARAVADRRESRRLQRRMDDTIRRETDRQTHRLRREAITDPLTGLGNRRTLEERLESLFGAERRRSRESVVAMVIDMDKFKSVNDTLGHDVGDQCLTFLGNLLTSTLRSEDCAIRLGGDEFVVLMPNLTLDEATMVAERLRALFGQMPWPHRTVRHPTLSIGLSSAACRDESGQRELLRRADGALYAAKSAGRNTVRSAGHVTGRRQSA